MADISKIQVPGSATQYNIKDAQARRDIEDVKADLNEMVRVVPQTLTEAQKTQAKVNLGIDETDSDAIKALQTDVDDIVDTLLDVTAKLGNASGGSSESSNLVSAIILEILSKGVYIEQMREKLWEAQLEMNPDKIRQLTAFTSGNISNHTFYIGDDVNAIRPYITVSAQTTDGYIVSVTSYELVGSLSNTSNTITVKYHGKTATVVIEAVTNPNGILYDWDFTQSLQDLRQNKTAILVGEAMRDSSGLKVTLPGRCKLFERDFNASQELLNKTIRIEVSSFKQLDTIGHYRFLMFSDPKTNKTSSEGGDDGLVCRRSGDNAYAGWSWYNNQAWKPNIFTGMASPTIISGSRINIYIASDGTLTLYLNGTSKGSLDTKFNATDHFGIMIGNKYSIGLNSGNGNFEAIITSFKIYNGLVTS